MHVADIVGPIAIYASHVRFGRTYIVRFIDYEFHYSTQTANSMQFYESRVVEAIVSVIIK
jgi:hypothetical protein